jgi:hypothetical protein
MGIPVVDWVCFAQQAPPCAVPKRPSLPKFGFVSQNRRGPQRRSHPGDKLALFDRIAPVGAPRPSCPPEGQIGSVCTTGQPPKLGLFGTIRPRGTLPSRSARWQEFGLFVQHPLSGRLAKIGFVSPKSSACPINHKSSPIKDLPHIPLQCQLGLFRTNGRRSVPNPQSAIRNPQSGDWLCFAR